MGEKEVFRLSPWKKLLRMPNSVWKTSEILFRKRKMIEMGLEKPEDLDKYLEELKSESRLRRKPKVEK